MDNFRTILLYTNIFQHRYKKIYVGNLIQNMKCIACDISNINFVLCTVPIYIFVQYFTEIVNYSLILTTSVFHKGFTEKKE